MAITLECQLMESYTDRLLARWRVRCTNNYMEFRLVLEVMVKPINADLLVAMESKLRQLAESAGAPTSVGKQKQKHSSHN